MDAVVMCGGKGTRLDADVEKPLFEVGGRPMIDRVVSAVGHAAGVDEVHAAVSPHTPATREHLEGTHWHHVGGLSVVRTPGEGYVADLDAAIGPIDAPILTVAADLPLLTGPLVDDLIGAFDDLARSAERSDRVDDPPAMTVAVPAALKRRLGLSVDATVPASVPGDADANGDEWDDGGASGEGAYAPAGVNVVTASEEDTMHTSYDARLAVNVNRIDDAAVAEALLIEESAPVGTGNGGGGCD